jgi:hypothetical protein
MTRLWFGGLVVVTAMAGCAQSGTGNPLPAIGGSGGSTGGSGGAAAGAGGSGAADLLKCEPADPAVTGAALHAAAAEVLTTMGKSANGVIGACTFSSCHNTPSGKAMLVLQGQTDLTTLRGKASCEAPTVPLIGMGGGDAALQNSWLYLKLVSPADPSTSALIANQAWGSGGLCGVRPNEPFGERMPMSAGMVLDSARLTPVRKWICAGAPMP